MGAGKKELVTSNHDWSSTRNLGKSHLGGVIFGTKNTTINECLSKQLFGLPNQHFVYVEKIGPGLPLFLFNYTDRKLHGIFEAASHGQKNIDPYSWTSDGLQRTPYPAQVQVRIRSQCQPLTENQFKPIIVDNYYTQNHFWFELDHSQTNKLLSLFSSRPVSDSQSTLTPHGSTKWSICLPSVSKSDEKVEKELVQSNRKGTSNGVKSSANKEKDICKSFNGKIDQSLDDSLCMVGKDEKELVYTKLKELALNCKFMAPPAASHEHNNALKNEMTNDSSKEVAIHDEKKEDALAKSSEGPMIAKLIEKVEDLMAFKTEQNHKIGCLEMKIVSLEQNLVFIYLINYEAEAENEIRNLKCHCIMLESMVVPPEESHTINGRKSPEFQLDNLPSTSEFHMDSSPERSDIHLDSDELILLVGGYDGTSWFSSLDSYSPSQNRTKSLKPMNAARCYAPVSILDGELYVFGGGTGGV
ncbi:Development/cell death domain-containing protein [Cynara cardunculus var. scolymus]|uniref:Development/cell death domain-containing protein n=1 Tax=Cynara cardunculus var. scolymus TaxID=59895 RepID=A0A118K1T2_CYNCS|nr:Development/cell death domain-containing protein [Cynara cardunculus var. scolymus]